MLEVLSCFVTITYLDFQEFFLFLHELSFILRHMVTQAHSQKSGGMRTAHVMLNLTKYRIKQYRIWYHCIPLQGTTQQNNIKHNFAQQMKFQLSIVLNIRTFIIVQYDQFKHSKIGVFAKHKIFTEISYKYLDFTNKKGIKKSKTI